MRGARRLLAALVLGGMLLAPGAVYADDHLGNAATSEGTDNREFSNPVAANPSGTSGAAAQPGTVPGLGDPKAGEDQGTPSVDHDSRCERLDARSNGDGGC